MSTKFNQLVESFIAQMEGGTAPWVKPWTKRSLGFPKNPLSGTRYSGINLISLLLADGVRFATFKQIKKAGGTVRKGAEAKAVHFLKPVFEVDSESDSIAEEGASPVVQQIGMMMKTYIVFDLDLDTEGLQLAPLPVSALTDDNGTGLVIEQLVNAVGATVRHSSVGKRAFYSSAHDSITMPPMDCFDSKQAYLATLAHELIHWTGAQHRRARTYGKKFCDPQYAFEELVAELGAAFLCSVTGLQATLQHPEYLASWAKHVRSNPRAVLFKAANLATQAVDFILLEAAKNGLVLPDTPIVPLEEEKLAA